MLLLVAGHALLQRFDGGGIRLQPAVPGLRARGHEQQHGHPDVTDDHVDRGELAEQGGIDLEHFLHRGLVGAAADPAAGQRGHAAPGFAGHRFRMQEAHRRERHQRAQHHADSTGQEHDQRLRPEPGDAADVHRHAEQHQRCRQQVVAGHRVQARTRAIDQAGAVGDRRQQVARQDRRHHRVELLPEAPLARCAPEHEAEDDRQQPEDRGVAVDQRIAGSFIHVQATPSSRRTPGSKRLMRQDSKHPGNAGVSMQGVTGRCAA